MVVKGNVEISKQEVRLTCPKCGGQHDELLVVVENRKQSTCPKCGHTFNVRV